MPIVVATQPSMETLQAGLEDEGLWKIDKRHELPRLDRSKETPLKEAARTPSQGNYPSEKRDIHPETTVSVTLGMRLPSTESLAWPHQMNIKRLLRRERERSERQGVAEDDNFTIKGVTTLSTKEIRGEVSPTLSMMKSSPPSTEPPRKDLLLESPTQRKDRGTWCPITTNKRY